MHSLLKVLSSGLRHGYPGIFVQSEMFGICEASSSQQCLEDLALASFTVMSLNGKALAHDHSNHTPSHATNNRQVNIKCILSEEIKRAERMATS